MYIFCKYTNETGRAIADYLGCEFGLNPPDGSFIVNYGARNRRAALNAEFVANKKSQLIRLSQEGFNVPEVIDCNPRRITTNNFDPEWFPCIGRKISHRKGTDIVWLPNIAAVRRRSRRLRTRDFLVRYVPKSREFRVHVLGNKWRSMSEKRNPQLAPPYNPNRRQELIWAFRYGWEHCIVTEDDPVREDIGHIAFEAAKTLNFNFGAVDLMIGEDGRIYVLEVNAAPRLNNRRIELYADYFARRERGRIRGRAR